LPEGSEALAVRSGDCCCGDRRCRYSADPEPEGMNQDVWLFLLSVLALGLALYVSTM